MMNRKKNLETLDKAYRVRFLKDNFETIAFIVLISVIFIAFVLIFFINFKYFLIPNTEIILKNLA